MATLYYDSDASFQPLQGKNIVIFGFGSQGHAHALNLKDSGLNVRVALKADSPSIAKAKNQGLEVFTNNSEAAKWADVAMIVIPDEHQKDLYDKHIKDNLKKGAALFFAHGFNIHFKRIVP